MTFIPRRRAPRAISTGTAVSAVRGEDDHEVVLAEAEVVEDDLGETRRALDEHRLALPVRADDLGMERHRQLDDRIEPGKLP